MKLFFILMIFFGISISPVSAAPVGTAFSYQGYFETDGVAVNGSYDMIFRLYDAPEDGINVAPFIFIADYEVVDGLVAVELDFGDAAFSGEEVFLQIQIREGASPLDYTILSPRQKILTVPYAIQSEFTADGASVWQNENAGIRYIDGDVIIGTDGANGSKLQVESASGVSPLRVKIDGVGTKLRVHGNGGTSVGVNFTPPENGLYVQGGVKQPIDNHGFAKAGIRFICGNSGTTIFEQFNNVNANDIVVTSNLPESGRCELSFPFDIDSSYVSASPFSTNIVRGVSCGKTSSGGNDIIECNGYNPLNGTRVDLVVTVLLF